MNCRTNPFGSRVPDNERGSSIHRPPCWSPGFTLAELIVIVAIMAVLAGLSISYYSRFIEKSRNTRVVLEIRDMERTIAAYYGITNTLPETLADVGIENAIDRWGNPYQYLRIEDSDDSRGDGGKGKQRRDRNMNPINTDYDLYSMGKDGETSSQLNSAKGRDDVLRALNGEFVGLASDF